MPRMRKRTANATETHASGGGLVGSVEGSVKEGLFVPESDIASGILVIAFVGGLLIVCSRFEEGIE